MRKIVAGLFVTLDGVVEIPEAWMGPYFTPELGQTIGSLMGAQDAMLLGRITYEMFAAHWPNQAGDMADTMNGTPKYVVSGTLESADWQNSTLIPAAGAFAEIAKLKEEPGQNIGMTGSGTLVSSLLREGLLDELQLFVFPLVVGSGKRLFGASDAQLPLKLLDSATFGSGVMHLTYAKA
jgi:dihydrofolate reductase